MHDHDYLDPEHTFYLAGERVVAGFYRQLDVQITIHLESEDFLPASLDGHVACYVRTVTARQLFSRAAPTADFATKFREESSVQEDTSLR